MPASSYKSLLSSFNPSIQVMQRQNVCLYTERSVTGGVLQSPAALTADIDRLGDSGGPQKLVSAPLHAQHILDASLSYQGISHPAGTS